MTLRKQKVFCAKKRQNQTKIQKSKRMKRKRLRNNLSAKACIVSLLTIRENTWNTVYMLTCAMAV